MKHEIQVRYPAPSDVVMKMFTDKDFHTRKLDVMGLRKFAVLEHEFDGKELRIRIEREVPVNAPRVLRKVLPAQTTVVNEESWNVALKTGRVKAQPRGVPVEMSCSASLRDEAGGCVVTYVWDVRASLPLIGGALERFVCADMDKRLAAETQAAISLLKDYR